MTKRTENRWKILPRGSLAGKKITFAPTEEVEVYADIAREFMSSVFELNQGDYAISDESDMFDFISFDESRTDTAWALIKQNYGLVKTDVDSERLVKIFKAISIKQNADEI